MERFWSKVDRSTPGCWQWLASTNPQGYGMFWLASAGRPVGAHRVAYELTVGPVPEGMEIDHLCRNRACVNPAHMEPVRHAENVRRGAGGTNNRGKDRCPSGHPYTPENVYAYRGSRICRTCRRDRKLAA